MSSSNPATTIIDADPNEDWRSALMHDEQGNILHLEANADLILRHDPLIRHAIEHSAKENERATMDALLFLQRQYKLRISYHTLSIMVRLLSENHAKTIRRASYASDSGYFGSR